MQTNEGDPEGNIWSKDAPEAREVNRFHTNSDVDKDGQSLHHTLGPNRGQAAPGDHRHRGDDSMLLFEGETITGSRTNGTAVQSIIALLTQFGVTDSTTA